MNAAKAGRWMGVACGLGLWLGIVAVEANALLSPELEGAIDGVFEKWVSLDGPGAVVGVVERGELVYSRGYGSANLDYEVPLGADSVIYLASTSKQFTAAQIALLHLEGVLSLDDDVRRWIPELPDYSPVYGTTITVRHLVHHTSGLRDYLTLMSLRGSDFQSPFTNLDGIELVARQKGLNFAPGSQYMYSNSNYILLAEIAERASGQTGNQLAKERIFGPLGMSSTIWGSDSSRVQPRRVTSYRPAPEKGTWHRFVQNFGAWGDGNLWSTAEDLARWDGNFYSGKVGGQPFLDLILTPGRLADGTPLDYAFGLSHGSYRGLPTVSHGGGMLGYRISWVRFPEQEVTLMVLANAGQVPTGSLLDEVADLVFEDRGVELGPSRPVEIATRIAIPPAVMESYTGEYYDGAFGRLARVTLTDEGELQVLSQGRAVALHGRSARDFANVEFSVEASFDDSPDGPVPGVELKIGDGAPVRFERLERERPTEEELGQLAGSYHSEELDTRWQITVDRGVLRVTMAGGGSVPFVSLDHDRFHSPQGALAFERDEKGSLLGYRAFAGRAHGIWFEPLRVSSLVEDERVRK